MSTLFPVFTDSAYPRPTSNISQIMAPSAPPNSKPLLLQHVELPAKSNINTLAQTSQNLKIWAKQAMDENISIPDGLIIKENIGKLGLMWLSAY